MSHQPDRPAADDLDPNPPALDPAIEARMRALFQRLAEEDKRRRREEEARKLAGPVVRVKHSA
jgi:hypothetical protein